MMDRMDIPIAMRSRDLLSRLCKTMIPKAVFSMTLVLDCGEVGTQIGRGFLMWHAPSHDVLSQNRPAHLIFFSLFFFSLLV